MNIKQRITLVLSTILLLTLISACNTKTNADKGYTPSEAVENFYKHAKAGELDEAEKYIAKEVIDYYTNNSNTSSGTLSYAITDEGSRYTNVKGKEEKINGQTAVVKAEITNKSNNTFNKDYNLIKEDEGWKLLFQ